MLGMNGYRDADHGLAASPASAMFVFGFFSAAE
jgi:hypothetical protein